MSRSRAGSEPLSLFSFQDIITSISGIMVLIVLMLILDLLNRKTAELPPAPKPVDARVLAAEVAALERDAQQLRREVADSHTAVEDLGKTDFGVLPQEIAREKARYAALKAEVDRLTPESETLEKRLVEEAGREKVVAAELAEKEKVLARMDKLTADGGKRFVHFVAPTGTKKTPVLVECASKGIRVKVMGDRPELHAFAVRTSIHHSSAIGRFSAWRETRDRNREAYVVLIKPSAAGYAMDVVYDLRNAKFDVGHEPIEEDKEVVFEE